MVRLRFISESLNRSRIQFRFSFVLIYKFSTINKLLLLSRFHKLFAKVVKEYFIFKNGKGTNFDERGYLGK